MSVYLNTSSALTLYNQLVNSEYFVDKSDIIRTINKRIRTNTKYICVTKPRRFGKTSVLNMLGAYYCKADNAQSIFDNLNISKSDDYRTHLNNYNVINMSLNSLPENGNTYESYINLIKDTLRDDLTEAYPEFRNRNFRKISDMLTATNDEFIFIIDEWDYIFNHNLYMENQSDFLEFLRDLLKDRPYVALAYMTGILPIKRYSTGSALNMFKEYTMLSDPSFEKYFGFTEEEVTALCKQQTALTLEDVSEWYDGYQIRDGGRIYNPSSVVCALEDGVCRSYWTTTGKMDEVLFFLKYNINEVKEDVIKMVNHIPVRLEIRQEYTAGQGRPVNRKEIYAAMIIYGLLSYSDGELRIPNKELMLEFESSLEADFIFYPRYRHLPGIVLELKSDVSPETALSQIKDKEYCEKLRKEKIKNILAVAISYDSVKKEHQCLIEEIF